MPTVHNSQVSVTSVEAIFCCLLDLFFFSSFFLSLRSKLAEDGSALHPKRSLPVADQLPELSDGSLQ